MARTPVEQLLPYLDAMLRENTHLSLTAVRDPGQARILHIEDSLAIAAFDLSPIRCLDLGSGNGFPGIALCALYPQAEVFLMERTGKKVAAISRILEDESVKTSGLGSPHLLRMDAAQAPALQPDLLGCFDLVTARALAPPEEAATLARPFLGEGGSLVLWLVDGAPAPEVSGFSKPFIHRYTLPEPAGRARCLVRYRLVAD